MVEVVNVGMNDDEKETQAFLLPYSNKEFLRERMHRLLPEFADYLDFQVERQPKSVWIVGLYSDIIYLLVVLDLFYKIHLLCQILHLCFSKEQMLFYLSYYFQVLLYIYLLF
jgi:transposase